MIVIQHRVQKVHEIEQQTWSVELADMRRLVDDEVEAMRRMFAQMPDGDRPTSQTSWASDNDIDDSLLDVESLRLKLDFDEDSFGLPSKYFHNSNQSLFKDDLELSNISIR